MTLPIRYCAAYTRKSTEEGLEQNFNSLDAQREACLAYIASQKAEGWVALPEAYDDGGFSGGNMERPALKRLLADIKAGKIHTIVVYKIDRLSRSLMDFAKLVEVFDQYNVTFVSVTQAFSTTTSMGRLTLNVLLSFAQFEREVTGERIRDKIAASKQKGMWMGGNDPFGYQRVDKKLVPYESEVPLVRMIFESYLELGSVTALHQHMKAQGVRTRTWVSSRERQHGGLFFTRGSLHKMLTNPVYIGKIRHRAAVHDGLHEAIISQDLWERVQLKLMDAAPRARGLKMAKEVNILKGLLYNSQGAAYVPSHTIKGPEKRRYRYYVNPIQKTSPEPHRLPALEAEQLIEKALREQLSDPNRCADLLSLDMIDHHASLLRISKGQNSLSPSDLIKAAISKVRVEEKQMVLNVRTDRLSQLLASKLEVIIPAVAERTQQIAAPFRLSRNRSGGIIVPPAATQKDMFDLPPSELKKLVQGFIWMDEHLNGEALEAIARRTGYSDTYVGVQIFRALDSGKALPA